MSFLSTPALRRRALATNRMSVIPSLLLSHPSNPPHLFTAPAARRTIWTGTLYAKANAMIAESSSSAGPSPTPSSPLPSPLNPSASETAAENLASSHVSLGNPAFSPSSSSSFATPPNPYYPTDIPSREALNLPPDLTLVDYGAFPIPDNVSSFANFFLHNPFPVPDWWTIGPYTTTIILSTIALRLAVTLPVTLWSRERERRLREEVMPIWKEYAARPIATWKAEAKADGFADRQLKKYIDDKTQTHKNHLLKTYNCTPLPTLIIPILTQLPLFVTMAYTLRSASQLPTPLILEHVPLLPYLNLATPDKWGILPICVGVTCLINADFVRAARRERDELDPWHKESQLVEKIEDKDNEGNVVVVERETKEGWKQGVWDKLLRAGAFAMVPISMFSPAAMQVYFLTTYTFNSIQAFLFRRSDRDRLLSHRASLRTQGKEPPLSGLARKLSPESPEPMSIPPISATMPTPKPTITKIQQQQPRWNQQPPGIVYGQSRPRAPLPGTTNRKP